MGGRNTKPGRRVSVDVLVVGGGPAGLTAAKAAADRGLSVRLVEAADEIGGMARSVTIAGQRVDLGSHRFHPAATPRVRALVDQLVGDDLQLRPRNGRLRLAGRWVRFPLRPLDMLWSVPPGFGIAIAADLMTGPLRQAGADTYAEVVRAGLGPAVLGAFHGPMATKLWGLPAEQLSGELARKRVAVRSGGRLVAKLAAGARPSRRTFLYPRLGYGQIVESLAEAAVAAGVDIDTSSTVVRVTPGPSGCEVHWQPRRGGAAEGTVATAHRIFWTAAPDRLADAVVAGPKPPQGEKTRGAVGGAIGERGDGFVTESRVDHRGLVLVYLVVPRRPWTEFDAHYVPDLDVAFSRVSEPANYRTGPDPENLTVLCAEIPCDEGDDRWTADRGELRDLVLDGMARVELPSPTVNHTEVRRLPSVYPVLTAANAAARRRRLEAAAHFDGVTVIGRQGRLVADNLHHVMEMSLSAVDCINPDGSWNQAAWTRAESRFETFVVED